MRLGLNQSARMEQRLVQSPQMIQAMQVLQLSTLDLEGRIEQELMENPFLEVAEGGEREGGDPVESAAPNPDEGPERPEVEGMMDMLESLERDFGDGRRVPRADSEAGDRKLEAMNNTPARAQSLGDALHEHLAFLSLRPVDRDLAEFLIYSLDERGYLTEGLEELAAGYHRHEASAEDFFDVLELLRDVTHPALGALDLRECLLLQLESNPPPDPLVHQLVDQHLEDITTNRLPRIARATGRTLEEIKEAIDYIRHLDPYPHHGHHESVADAIHPDVMVELVDGEYRILLPRQRIPDLMVAPNYRRILEQAGDDEGVRSWVKKRLESARWFINAVQQRQSTLERIATSIFERQRAFLDEGLEHLVPMRMQEVADEAGVHISTVSRAAAGKYAQTPRGIFPLKFFFTSGTVKEDGAVESQTSIKDKLRRLVEGEDPREPLSDDQLAELLAEREGIRIARRTVTKYRRALEIPSSSQRREF